MRRKKIAIFDRLAIAFGIVTAFFNLPQLIRAWFGESVEGISLTSWSGFALASLFWLCYAILHRERALIAAFGSAFVLQVFIIFGVLSH